MMLITTADFLMFAPALIAIGGSVLGSVISIHNRWKESAAYTALAGLTTAVTMVFWWVAS